MRALLPLFEEYGVDAVFCGHDEMVEHSVVNGIDFFDTGSAGDGIRGPSAGITNPNQVFLAHTDAPEVWNGAQLVSGGKHYSHLEVNVTEGDHGEFEATIEPVYIFPLMNASGVVTGYERRVYDDVTVLVDPGLPGDANGDGVVDDADASILGAHWQQMGGATWHDGDFNGDFNVTDADAAILAGHWNERRGERVRARAHQPCALGRGAADRVDGSFTNRTPLRPPRRRRWGSARLTRGGGGPSGQVMATTSNRAGYSSRR